MGFKLYGRFLIPRGWKKSVIKGIISCMEGTILLRETDNDEQEPAKTGSSDIRFTPSKEPSFDNDESTFNSESEDVLSEPILKYIKSYREEIKQESIKPVTPLVVDELASKVAKLYEKVRRIIDWKEEHLVRRTAIERILKRRLIGEMANMGLLPDLDPEKIAMPLVLELIRGGHFENGKIPQKKVEDVQRVLYKYIYILRNNPVSGRNGSSKANIKRKINFYNWLLEVASCEIEEAIKASPKEIALIDLMTQILFDRIELIPADKMSTETKYVQTYIAVHRALFNLDEPIIRYHVIKHKYPQMKNFTEEGLSNFTLKVESVWKEIEEDLSHPDGGEFFKITDKYDTAYRLIGDVFENFDDSPESIESTLRDSSALENMVEDAYNKRKTTLKKRLIRTAVYSTLSIFIAGGVSLFLVEFPLAKWLYGEFKPWAMVVDIMVPTILMFILVILIRPPKKSNYDIVVEEVNKVVYTQESEDAYEIKLDRKSKKIQNILFAILYLIFGAAALYFIYWVFLIAGVPWTSLYIDTLNVAMIVFAAVIVKHRSREITIEERGGFLEFILDLFSMPLAKLGQWLSEKWKEYNIVAVFFTALVDTPFSTFVEIIEGWRNFIKNKRSQIH